MSECAILVMTFAIKHRLSQDAVEELLQLISLLLPEGSRCPATNYWLSKLASVDYSLVKTVFYCPSCQSTLELFESTWKCKDCDEVYDRNLLLKQQSYFAMFPLEETLRRKLAVAEVLQSFKTTRKRRDKKNSSTISDIQDGRMYKALGLQADDITCTVNCDGIPAFKSSKTQVHPLLISINELPYRLRRRHTMIAGIWFGKSKPNFDTFVQPFAEEAKRLADSGFSWPLGKQSVRSRVIFPLVVADSVARCTLQGLHQFNGQYGCPWCLHPGSSLQLETGGKVRVYLPGMISTAWKKPC
jgi:hypothetical protein